MTLRARFNLFACRIRQLCCRHRVLMILGMGENNRVLCMDCRREWNGGQAKQLTGVNVVGILASYGLARNDAEQRLAALQQIHALCDDGPYYSWQRVYQNVKALVRLRQIVRDAKGSNN